MTTKKRANVWIQSLKDVNKNKDTFVIPKKGTPDYDLAMNIMKHKTKAFRSKPYV